MSENLLMRGAAVAEWKDYKDILTERKGGKKATATGQLIDEKR